MKYDIDIKNLRSFHKECHEHNHKIVLLVNIPGIIPEENHSLILVENGKFTFNMIEVPNEYLSPLQPSGVDAGMYYCPYMPAIPPYYINLIVNINPI